MTGSGRALIEVTPKEYGELLLMCEEVKQPLFVRGGPGIGKSAIPRQQFTILAARKNLQFAEWCDLTLDKKLEILEDVSSYYIFMDARTSQMDTTSLMGIPNMANTELLENIPYSWVVALTRLGAHGAIFFDEINLAAPIVQAITYSAIHDRVISDRRIADDVFVFAAGNRQKDRAHTFDMPLPLRDRFAECEIRHDSDQWCDWAMSAKVNPHLIAFIRWKPSRLYQVDVSTNDKPSTPRGVHRASTLIAKRPIESETVHQLVSISCGSAFATEFQAYTTCYAELNWKTLLSDPSSVTSLATNQQYAVSAGCAERFQNDPKNINQFEQLVDLAECLRKDFTLNTFRMMRDAERDHFSGNLRKLKKGAEFGKKYGKYIVAIDGVV